MASTYHPRVYAYHKRTVNGMDYMRAGRYSGDGSKHCWNLVQRGKFEQRDGHVRSMSAPSTILWGRGGNEHTSIGFGSYVYAVDKGKEADIIHTPLWQPDQIPGMLVWLDAQDEDSFELVSTRVQRWRDKGPLGNDAVAPTSTNRPSIKTDSILGNGRSVLFGTSRWMNVGGINALDNPQPYTIVVVLNVVGVNLSHFQSIFSRTTYPELVIKSGTTNNLYLQFWWETPLRETIATGANYIVAEGNGATSRVILNGAEKIGEAGPGTWTGSVDGYTRIGNYGGTTTNPDRHYTGEMAEVMFFDRLMSAADITNLNVYINRKYAL